jgi:asparagine synthase (glutamine-hydrolysing)
MVVAAMAKLTDRPVVTFTVGFKDADDANELAEARETSRLFGTDHHEVMLDHSDYQGHLARMVWHLDEPVATTSALAMYSVCQLARRHVKVVLTGQGADEPMGGYVRYYGERYGHWFRLLPKALRNGALSQLIEALPRRERAKRAVRSLGLEDPAERFAAEYAVFAPEIRARLWHQDFTEACEPTRGVETIRYWLDGINAKDPLGQMTYVDARMALADDLLLYGDKMSMANSVEARVPFLDLEFMALAERLPAELKIRGLARKYIHKRVAAKWLPARIIRRRKRTFETPIDRWFRSELSGYVKEVITGKQSACARYFREPVIEGLLRDHVSGRHDYRRQLFSLLVFELWHQVFIDRSPQCP